MKTILTTTYVNFKSAMLLLLCTVALIASDIDIVAADDKHGTRKLMGLFSFDYKTSTMKDTYQHVCKKIYGKETEELKQCQLDVVTCRSPDVVNPLMCAAKVGNSKMTSYLLKKLEYLQKHPISEKSKDLRGTERTALDYAIGNCHFDVADQLMKSKVQSMELDSRRPRKDYDVPQAQCSARVDWLLSTAVVENRSSYLQALLAENPSIDINHLKVRAQNILMYAIEKCDSAIVESLITQGHAKLNEKNAINQTPLIVASKQEEPAICGMLLRASTEQNNVDINHVDNQDQSALGVSLRHENPLGSDKCTQVLLNNGAFDVSSFKYAMQKGLNADIVNKIVNNCKDPNRIGDDSGKTPLMYASQYGYLQACKIIVNQHDLGTIFPTLQEDVEATVRSYINEQDQATGYSALMHSIKSGSSEIAAFLIEKGATNDGIAVDTERTALMMGIAMGNNQIIEIIEQMLTNADVSNIDKKDKDGNTALMIATQKGYFHIVEKLVNMKCDLKLQNNIGDTALHIALKSQHPYLVEYLLNAKAPNTPNNDGATPLMLAAISNEDTKNLYLLAKSNKESINLDRHAKTKRTAIMMAALAKLYDNVEVLLAFGAQITDELRQVPTSTDIFELLRNQQEFSRQQLQADKFGIAFNIETN